MTDAVHPLVVAVWQAASTPRDVDANLAALDAVAARAAADGAHLLITPEMYVSGYNIGDAMAGIAARQPLERVRRIAERHRIAIIAGGPELLDPAEADPAETTPAHADPGRPVANAAWFIDDTGEVLARHRKIQLFGELDRDLFVAGDAPLTIAEFRGHRIAILICFDVEFPETVRAAALAGADLVAVPTAQMEPYGFVNEHVIRVRAWENSVFVAYANQHGPDGELRYVGRSVIADPFGAHVVQADSAGEALIFGDVDRIARERARRQNPYLDEVRTALFRSGERT
ncbi:nitrilase-related carbon-nitrogen hydrolase [Leucobacter chromiiresistens]|uniref:Nitrilase n=1 Tax=Leucobacter chromiiresistens TaxID=1079994 RepID=A0A147ERN6_9MICO|nr:nitrilase-related carbon-nitrogen hydrolase [Leucobacter chromiiresistens]KTR87264.1 nitrilase [Leucobacter chromiiresistens]